jgi:nucleotide-binding universal stress UspA family protein
MMQQAPYRIVVGVDFGKLADRAFDVAYRLCARNPAAELHVVSVVQEAEDSYLKVEATVGTPPFNLEPAGRRLAAHVDALLGSMKEDLVPNVTVVSHVVFEVPVIGITNLALELQAEMIVLGTHGRRGLARWLLGSVAEGILRHASCPVFVIPPLTDPNLLPVIDAPCSHCVEARGESGGRELWCVQHRDQQGRRHTYHQARRPDEGGSTPAEPADLAPATLASTSQAR